MSSEAVLVGRVYGQVSAAVADLDPADLRRSTRTAGWSVADLLFHLLLDAQRVLVTLASPARGPADTDRVSYWQPFRPGADPDGDAAHAAYVRRSAAAYTGSGYGVVPHWTETAAAASRAAQAVAGDGTVATQGHLLSIPDFLSTIVVEATVHYLDLTVELAAPPVDADALAHTVGVLEQILGGPLPAGWSAEEAVLKGTGRTPLTALDLTALGAAADRFPLLG